MPEGRFKTITTNFAGDGIAERVDEHTGIVERARFFGAGDTRMFGMTYLPPDEKIEGGVVMCPPLLAQFNAHYRRGTLLARALAAAGLAVHRFHYRGTGNSDGRVDEMTLATIVDDTQEAAKALVEQIGTAPISYVGVSLGAYPAARGSQIGNPLVLDSPPSTGRSFFRKAFRSHAIAVMREGASSSPKTQEMIDQLLEHDNVSLLGFRLPRSLYVDLMERQLIDEIGSEPRPVLVVERNRSGELSAEGKKLVEGLTGRSMQTEALVLQKEDPFWYVDDSAPENAPEIVEGNDRLASWLVDRLGTDAGGS